CFSKAKQLHRIAKRVDHRIDGGIQRFGRISRKWDRLACNPVVQCETDECSIHVWPPIQFYHECNDAKRKLPNGLAFSCRERASSCFQKPYDLVREAVSWNTVLGRLLKRWSLLHAQRVDDAFNLRDMRSFMVCQPLGIRMH